MRSSRLATTTLLLATSVAGLASAAACVPSLTIPPDAQLKCGSDDECPAGAACSTGGLCVAGGPCVVQGTKADVVADGTACGDGGDGGDGDGGADDRICVAGACVAPFCGDGVVQLADGEDCDPRKDPKCREDCTLPRCGDGFVDAVFGETCDDVDDATCVDCSFECRGTVSGTGANRTLTANGDCNLDAADGCECAPRQFDVERVDERIFQQAAVRGDIVYLVSATPGFNLANIRFRLERVAVGAGAAFTRTTIADDINFLNIAEPEHIEDGSDPDGDDVYYQRSQPGFAQLRRIDKDGADTLIESATSDADLFGHIAVDTDSVWGTGLQGMLRIDRTGGAVEEIDVDVCHSGFTSRIVSCGDVVACYDVNTGDFDALDKSTHAVTKLFNVAPVAGVIGGAQNDQVLFCGSDGKLAFEDRVAVWSLDGDGGRTLTALLPNLVGTTTVDAAQAIRVGGASGVLVAGVEPRTGDMLTVFVDLDARTSTVLMPGLFAARHQSRVVSIDGLNGSLIVADLGGGT